MECGSARTAIGGSRVRYPKNLTKNALFTTAAMKREGCNAVDILIDALTGAMSITAVIQGGTGGEGAKLIPMRDSFTA
jgi:hypothetical protein